MNGSRRWHGVQFYKSISESPEYSEFHELTNKIGIKVKYGTKEQKKLEKLRQEGFSAIESDNTSKLNKAVKEMRILLKKLS